MNPERRLAYVVRLEQLREARAAAAPVGERDDELREIEAALHRVAEDVYGICVACGGAIAPERLELLPATPHCVDCACRDSEHPAPTGRHPTVPAGRFHGEQLGFVTDTELGDLLEEMLRQTRVATTSGLAPLRRSVRPARSPNDTRRESREGR